MPITEDEIRATAERYKAATLKAEEAMRNDTAARQALSDQREIILLNNDPKELGSNEAQRSAALNERTQAEIEQVRVFEEAARAARTDVTIVGIEWSMVRKLVDLALACQREVA